MFIQKLEDKNIYFYESVLNKKFQRGLYFHLEECEIILP